MDVLTEQPQNRKSLPDFSSECFILILQLRSTNDYGEANSLKLRVSEMFERFEKDARSAGIDGEKIKSAKFALVAFLDETIISSSWNQKDTWLSEPLQIKLFDTFNAGEEFFTNLSELRLRTTNNKDVLEIYYLCLSLGFKGKYQLQSPENLRRVIDDLNMELHPEMYNSIDAISPNAKPKDGIIQYSKNSIPLWVYPAGAVIIFLVFYFILSGSISGNANDVVEMLKNLKI